FGKVYDETACKIFSTVDRSRTCQQSIEKIIGNRIKVVWSDMVIIDFLLEKLTKESYPVVNDNKCMSNCRKCEDICPSNAISRERGKIYIKNDLCHMCGICKSQCPTQAIN